MLGHASLQQTQRYLNVTDDELRKGLEVSWRRGRALWLVADGQDGVTECHTGVTPTSGKCGAPGGIRTHGLWLRRPTPPSRLTPTQTTLADFPASFEGARQLLTAPNRVRVSHLCHTAAARRRRRAADEFSGRSRCLLAATIRAGATIRVTAETTTGVIVMARTRPHWVGVRALPVRKTTSQKTIHAIATKTREG
jgi:hypothetical protein